MQTIHHINRIKSHVIISIDRVKTFHKILYPFMIKTQQSRNRKELSQIDKEHSQKPQS